MIVRPRHRRAQSGRSRQAQRAIEEAIKERILLDRLQTGDPIPTESEFVEELGISRNSVREALKALQAVDIVEIRHGYGTYVGGGSLDPLADALVFRGRKALHDTREINEIVDVREALEVGFIGHVATIIDRAELDRLADRLEDLRIHAGPGDAGERADRAFHDELYAPLRNQLMSQLLRVFWDVYHALSPQLSVAPQDRIDIIAGHEAIYAAVAAHDAENATVAMRKHFAGIRHRLDGALTSQGLSRR
ncbi:MAG: FadR/GntR family transcriptional regulator [Solirubrobacteraceae bacterium]